MNSLLVQPLLIEPLWNWNVSTRLAGRVGLDTFNRTIVELKQLSFLDPLCYGVPFNRTIVELKPALALSPSEEALDF